MLCYRPHHFGYCAFRVSLPHIQGSSFTWLNMWTSGRCPMLVEGLAAMRPSVAAGNLMASRTCVLNPKVQGWCNLRHRTCCCCSPVRTCHLVSIVRAIGATWLAEQPQHRATLGLQGLPCFQTLVGQDPVPCQAMCTHSSTLLAHDVGGTQLKHTI